MNTCGFFKKYKKGTVEKKPRVRAITREVRAIALKGREAVKKRCPSGKC